MADALRTSKLGTCVFGGAAIALGIIGLISRNFAVDWQHVGPDVHHRHALALLAAACEVAGGAAVVWRRTARAGAALLGVLYAIFVFLWLRQAAKAPLTYDS